MLAVRRRRFVAQLQSTHSAWRLLRPDVTDCKHRRSVAKEARRRWTGGSIGRNSAERLSQRAFRLRTKCVDRVGGICDGHSYVPAVIVAYICITGLIKQGVESAEGSAERGCQFAMSTTPKETGAVAPALFRLIVCFQSRANFCAFAPRLSAMSGYRTPATTAPIIGAIQKSHN
jgi:hypothetical protein